ncbi:MAG: hypothetical protein GXO89_05335 [Chlorobi bacterium]|nr:hypothetical protein [Chlorobiota bacterium]
MTRSPFWQKNIVLNILLGILVGIMLLYLLVLGLFIDKILMELFPDKDPIMVFNGIIIYYFAFEFFIRFFMQSLPTLNIETYLHLPIKKSAIVHYVSSKSIFAIGNYLSWLVFFPFAFKVIAPAYSVATAWAWAVMMVLLIFSNNFLATYIKRQLANKPSIVGFFGLGLVAFILFDYFGVISLTALSSQVFGLILKNYLFLLPVFVILIFTYSLNCFFLKAKLYPDEIISKKKGKVDSLANIKYLKTLGLTGRFISLDLRLLWRHKRTRSIIFMAPLFLGYGLVFYPNQQLNNGYSFLIFVGIFMTGGMMMNYLNYCFSYESNYFDNILANYRDFEAYIKAKYILAVTVSTISYIITIPYVFFSTDILLINTMTWLYNLGFLSFVLYYFATFTKKRMDLSRGAAFNYQGLGATHWLSMLPAFLLPVLIYVPFNLLGYSRAGLLFIGAIGIAGLLFHKSMLSLVLKQFLKRKHVMAAGFRE